MQKFREYVDNLQRKITVDKTQILFVCIGNYEIIGDSIGPLVGSYLKEKIGEKKVIGDMYHNICCKKDLIKFYPKMKNKFIIAIDSALSSKELEGEIFVNHTPVIMGLGLERKRGVIGDISIKACIYDLEQVNKQYVNNLSEMIGKGIWYWYQKNQPKV